TVRPCHDPSSVVGSPLSIRTLARLKEKVCPTIGVVLPRNFKKFWCGSAWTRNFLLARGRPKRFGRLRRSSQASLLEPYNHTESRRTIIASLEWTHRRALQARRTVKRFATRCNVRGVPLRGPRPAVLVVSCDNPGA